MTLPAPLRRWLTAAAWLLFGAAAAANEDAVTLQVYANDVLAAVNPQVLRGYNVGNESQAPAARKLLRGLQPRLLRVPGGAAADQADPDDATLQAVKAQLDAMGGADLLLQTRAWPGTLGPAEVTATAQRADRLGLNVRLWEVGHQPDQYPVRPGDEGGLAERYCQVFRTQALAIKRADPRARVAGPAVSGQAPGRDQFLKAFIRDCGDVVDLLSFHLVPTDGQADETQALNSAGDAEALVRLYRELWADPQRNPKGHARKIRLGVTTYALSSRTDAPRHAADFVAAMWAIEVALRLNEQGVDMAHYAALQGGVHGLLDAAGKPRPTYHAFRMLSAVQGFLIGVRTRDPDLWVHAAQDGELRCVFIINRSTRAKTIATVLPKQRLTGGELYDAKMASGGRPPQRIGSSATTVSLAGQAILRLNFRPPLPKP